MRKFNFKFDRRIEGTETCDVTVLADNKDEAYEKFANKDWSTFLIAKRDVVSSVDDDFITSFKDNGHV